MSFVYFAQNESGHIKVGVTSDVRRRISTLNTSTPDLIKVIGVMHGDRDVERRIHGLLADSHIGGEWYKHTSRVDTFLAQCEPYNPEKHVMRDRIVRPYNELGCVLIRRLAEPVRPGETIAKQRARVAAMLPKWPKSRIRDVWYCADTAMVSAEQIAELEALLDARKQPKQADLETRVADLEMQVAELLKTIKALRVVDRGQGREDR